MSPSIEWSRVFAVVPQAIFVVAPDAPRFSLVAATSAAHGIAGTSPERLGAGLFDVLGNQLGEPAALRGSLERVIATGAPQRISTHRRRAGDPTVLVSVRTVPVAALGKLDHILCCIDDVGPDEGATSTEGRELREARLVAELERANRELDAFSYSVSHDLRAPLRAIQGFSQALEEDCGPRLDGECREHLRYILQATQRMGRLIDDLLALSRVGRSAMQEEDVDVSALASDVIDRLRRRYGEREVETSIAPAIVVRGDQRLLTIVFESLIGNAWKFSAKTPAARIEIGVAEGAVFVRDNGAGFDPAYAAGLFQPFQRLHGADEFEGTGIGLAIVKRVIDRHGGRVWAESAPGKGATFFLGFPP